MLGFVSLFMDISSELVHALLPLYLTVTLGVGMTTVGVVEGIAEATAAFTKMFSGAVSDYLGRRKLLAVIGYGLAALTKPVFPLAGSVGWVVFARFVDRIGKGIRGAPRDALIADLTAPEARGAAFGLRQALDAVGAVIGPVLAVGLMATFAQDLRAVLWVAVLPAALAVGLLIVGVAEPPHLAPTAGTARLSLRDASRLGRRFWNVNAMGAAFTLARFSEAFLVLKAADLGLGMTWAPAVMIVMSAVYALVAFPAGHWADGRSARGLLLTGLAVLVAADLVLAFAREARLLFIGVALWGAHMGLTQGLMSKLVADTAPADLRGTAFGLFNFTSGVALLGASLIAGALWDDFGPRATFLGGAAFAAVAAGALLWRRR